MNPSTDAEPTPSGATRVEAEGSDQSLPSNWREALTSLIASRVTLIQLESKDAASDGARRAVLLIVAAGCAFFAWALVLAGIVALLSEAMGRPWYCVAISMGIVHLLLGLLLGYLAKSSSGSAFPITRAEFKKDREWLNNFHDTRKSNS